MEEPAEESQQSSNSSLWGVVCFVLVFSFSSRILRDLLPSPITWALAGMLASGASYIVSPVKVGFVKYFVFMQVCLSAVLIAVWLAPPLLESVMPKFWAYFLPTELLANAIYFVRPFDGSKRGAWWKWFLGSSVFVAVCSWFLSSI